MRRERLQRTPKVLLLQRNQSRCTLQRTNLFSRKEPTIQAPQAKLEPNGNEVKSLNVLATIHVRPEWQLNSNVYGRGRTLNMGAILPTSYLFRQQGRHTSNRKEVKEIRCYYTTRTLRMRYETGNSKESNTGGNAKPDQTSYRSTISPQPA